MSGVYISYPFCSQKCSFCNFASGVHTREMERRYADALVGEIRAHQWAWAPDTVYLGGGTPSNMTPADLERVLDQIPGRPWREVTLEAAPGSLTLEKVREWRRLGVNRVSLGVQSFISRELAQTGRKHTAQIVDSDCELLRANGIEEVNIDLIAGLPHQTSDSWRESLDWIKRLNPPHVSVYLFEIDEDSRLGFEILNNGQRYGASNLPTEELAAELYESAVDALREMGIERYEISNFATPGHESIHNLKYWTMQPYVGFGVDAHSFDGSLRTGNVDDLQVYLTRVEAGESPAADSTPAHLDEERMFTGLRLSAGIELTPGQRDAHQQAIERFIAAGLLTQDGDKIQLTSRGVLLSNEVFQEFLAA